ncbi:hypothetical protein N9W17_03385 [Jannaschia sp.]|nr:hypothetical protein [Jannaschia sp.]
MELIGARHALLSLAVPIDWPVFEGACARAFPSHARRPGTASRRLAAAVFPAFRTIVTDDAILSVFCGADRNTRLILAHLRHLAPEIRDVFLCTLATT